MFVARKKTVTRVPRKTSKASMLRPDTISQLAMLEVIIGSLGTSDKSISNALAAMVQDKASRPRIDFGLRKTTASILSWSLKVAGIRLTP
jgi:hypothetical protein